MVSMLALRAVKSWVRALVGSNQRLKLVVVASPLCMHLYISIEKEQRPVGSESGQCVSVAICSSDL
jgi:hypothetical protein